MEIIQNHDIQFSFDNEMEIYVNIKFIILDENEYYQLTYIYGNNDKPTKESSILKCVDKELIIKNELTKKMIEYLLLNDTTLAEYTGTITPKNYKKSIILSLTNFLD